MSLLNLRRSSPTRRHSRSFRPMLYPSLESLEQRTVLSAIVAAPSATVAAPSILTITGINVTSLSKPVGNTLTATLSLTGQLLGHTVTIPHIQAPVTLTTTHASTTAIHTAAASATPILNLSLQIPDLDILGLHVRLDNCNGGPVTISLTAQPGGGLLGNLLSGLGNALNGSGALTALSKLTIPHGGNLLTQVLDSALSGLTGPDATSGTGTSGGSSTGTDTIPAGDTELVNLHLGPISLNLLGLNLNTSMICLNLYADPNGGLLGSLLSGLDNIGNPGGGGIVL